MLIKKTFICIDLSDMDNCEKFNAIFIKKNMNLNVILWQRCVWSIFKHKVKNSCYIFHVNKIDKIFLQLDNLNSDHFRF